MTAGELLAFLFLAPIFGIVGGIAGRYAQRRMWMLDHPYSERVAALTKWRKAA